MTDLLAFGKDGTTEPIEPIDWAAVRAAGKLTVTTLARAWPQTERPDARSD
jgi:hypothetical protein